MNFITKIESRDVSISSLETTLPSLKGRESGRDFEIENKDFTVFWSVELETREWGVKDISWYVTDIQGTFDVVHLDKNGDETDTETITFDFAPFKDNTSINIDDLENGRSIAVGDLDIYYDDKKISVY